MALSAVLVLLHGLLRGDWIGGALAGITLAMAMLPEEFGLILTVFMAMGAWRLSRQQVLTRRAATIEALGADRHLGQHAPGVRHDAVPVPAVGRGVRDQGSALAPPRPHPQVRPAGRARVPAGLG